MQVKIVNGPQRLPETVLSVELPAGAAAEGALTDPAHPARPLPYEVRGNLLLFQSPALAAGKTRILRFNPKKAYPARYGAVELEDVGGSLRLNVAGKPLTTYRYQYAPPQTRPVCYPLLGPGGLAVTRAWPLEEKAGEEQDHPHHRSLFFAHGAVNGVDFWSEREGAGVQVHHGFDELYSGRFAGGFSSRLTWQKCSGEPVIEEKRTLRFYNLRGNLRMFDVEMRFEAARGDVLFGDTKEGGLVSFRVAESMKEAHGGRIENGCGGVSEAQCWGKPAPWVDYSGLVRGKRLGIALFDHHDNLRHPSRWHVRAYGLFSLNPFGLSHYRYGRDSNGDYRLPAGETIVWRFRVLLHRGDARRGKVQAHYLAWAFPPQVTVEA